jgi:hypothetical protein
MKTYGNIRVTSEVKKKIDLLAEKHGSADNALRHILGLRVENKIIEKKIRAIPMKFLIVVILDLLDKQGALTKSELVAKFELKMNLVKTEFPGDFQLIPSTDKMRWYSKLGNAIFQARKSGFIQQELLRIEANTAWTTTSLGLKHLKASKSVIQKIAVTSSSDFLSTLLK